MRIKADGPFFSILTQSAFPLGIITLTCDAEFCLTREAVGLGIYRHAMGDWGEAGEETRFANDSALGEGGPLVSVFTAEPLKVRFRVVTDADRENTLVMLESELPEYEPGAIRSFGGKE